MLEKELQMRKERKEKNCEIFLVDIPRWQGRNIETVEHFATCEKLKNGKVQMSEYEGTITQFLMKQMSTLDQLPSLCINNNIYRP